MAEHGRTVSGIPRVASLLLVAMPFAPSSFLFLVVRPGALSSFLAPSSDARSPERSVLVPHMEPMSDLSVLAP